VLKIDKAFVMNMQDNTRYAAVVNTIISLARHLNLKVTAEGVETEEQLRLLEAAGCDYAQGYYFSRPVDGETAAELLTRDACLVAAG
jgi:EAL domain-containing protein (putative c-di-GMP-specific phosphodiesterase class I)